MADTVHSGRYGEKSLMEALSAAMEDLRLLREPSALERVKRLIKRALGREVADHDPVFWPAGLLMLGMDSVADSYCRRYGFSSDIPVAVDRALCEHFDNWLSADHGRLKHIDDVLSGVALMGLTDRLTAARDCGGDRRGDPEDIRRHIERYRAAIDDMYGYCRSAPRDREGAIIYNPARNNRIFADGVGQTTLFLSRYVSFVTDGRARDDIVSGAAKAFTEARDAMELAATQLREFRRYGMDDRTGLPYHAYELGDNGTAAGLGIIGWGRAAGWLMMGLAGYLTCCPEPDEELKGWYSKLRDDISSYRREDGLYPWALPCTAGPVDTSASAMIGWAIGNTEGTPAPEAIASIERGYMSQGRVTGALSACEDIAVHRQVYGHYPWGQGGYLMLVSVGDT